MDFDTFMKIFFTVLTAVLYVIYRVSMKTVYVTNRKKRYVWWWSK